MENLKCPLCGQNVTKSLYEKITGIWKEKEKQMSSLKAKEKALLLKEKNLLAKFEKEKKTIIQKEKVKFEKQFAEQQKQINHERLLLKKEKTKLQSDYKRKIAIETNRILKQEKEKHKELEKRLKLQFEKTANEKIKKENQKIERENKLQKNRYDQLNKQFRALQNKNMIDLNKANKKIKSLEEQIQKNQTPQMLGLLEEKLFLSKLKEMFPEDRFDHTGKGGDIVHYVINKNSEVGIICYELKKVSTFKISHITQAYNAKQDRKADYSILVTNAKRNKDDIGFSIQKGVIIIHPAGALVLVSLLRDHIISISKLKLSKEKREETINAVLNYIQSPVFKNGIENIIVDTIDLYNNLKKEVKNHINTWEERLDKYRNIHHQANAIESKVINLLVTDDKSKKQLIYDEIKSIDLPGKID